MALPPAPGVNWSQMELVRGEEGLKTAALQFTKDAAAKFVLVVNVDANTKVSRIWDLMMSFFVSCQLTMDRDDTTIV